MGVGISRAALTTKGFKPGETFDVAFEGKSIIRRAEALSA